MYGVFQFGIRPNFSARLCICLFFNMTATLSQPFVLADGTTALTIVPLQIVLNLNDNPHGFLVPGSAEMLLNREDYLGLREVGVNRYKLRPN